MYKRQTLIAALTAIVSACMISLCAILFFDYHMEGNPFLFLGAYVFVLFSMYGIGMIIAGLSPSLKAVSYTHLLYDLGLNFKSYE